MVPRFRGAGVATESVAILAQKAADPCTVGQPPEQGFRRLSIRAASHGGARARARARPRARARDARRFEPRPRRSRQDAAEEDVGPRTDAIAKGNGRDAEPERRGFEDTEAAPAESQKTLRVPVSRDQSEGHSGFQHWEASPFRTGGAHQAGRQNVGPLGVHIHLQRL